MSSKTKTTATKEDGKPALVPKLRFPEFREGWREMTFGELLDDIIDFRGRTPVKLGMEWGNGNITSLSANNVKNGFIDYKAECNLGSEELYQRWMGDVSLEKNDIVFTMEAPLGNALLLPDSRKYILSQRVVAFKTNSEVVNPFLVQLIWSEGFQNAISELSTGSTAKGINQKALKIVPVKIPHRKEQQKIAECLSSVDELIAAQARKVQALKTHKKGLMQQLFPCEGETQPRLRFPEFQNAGEWETTPLGDLGEIITGKTPSTKEADLWGGEILFITPTDIDEDSKYQHSADRTVVKTKSTKVLPAGSIVYTCIASIGKMALTVSPSITNQQINAVVPSENALGEFLYYALANLTPWIKTLPATNTLPIINKTDFSKIAILHPDKAEQQRIASCLSSLDDLITAETQKHEALKTHKKGLMQQLFPSPDEVEG